MDQHEDEQPSFLSLANRGKRSTVVDLTSRKRKAPDSKSKKSAPVEKSPLIAPQADTSVDAPTLPSPLPPSLSKGALWTSGVSNDLRDVICPPSRFYDSTSFSSSDIKELEGFELGCLKMASLARALLSLKKKYAKAFADLNSAREEKAKTYEELLKAKEDSKALKSRIHTLEETHSINVRSLQHCKVTIQEGEARLKAAQTELDEYRVELEKSILGSFSNALKQIRVLNPGVELNTAGLNHLAFVRNGSIVSPSPPPVDDSTTQIEDTHVEGGEEISQVAEEGRDAPAAELAVEE